jgi:hypothetical protein
MLHGAGTRGIRREADGRPLLLYEHEGQTEPGRLVMEARSIGSVRLSLMISELNHGQAAEADASLGAYLECPLGVISGR